MSQSTAAVSGDETQSALAPDRFATHLARAGLGAPRRERVTTLQLNIGKRCNLACHHCHVESGPKRSEALSRRGIERILALLERNPQVTTLDVTGGAPELHPDFRDLVRGARALGRRVIDRCNLTILFEPGQEDTAEFLASQGVDVVASLPCYTLENVEQQRGRGVFGRSIQALRALNALGYGRRDRDGERRGPVLDLIYNPLGPFLPPDQSTLEARYREELRTHFGVEFDALLTITNMPIKRFGHELLREGRLSEYMSLLVQSFNPATLPGLMCRGLISVDHEGRIYDCDFNQALEIPTRAPLRTIWDGDDLDALSEGEIATAAHCFGCTAGAGSSCGGAIS